MFKTKSSVLNLFLNFAIACVLFWAFSQLGWIHITSQSPLWLVVMVVGLVNILSAIIVFIANLLLSPVILIIGACTLGLGLIIWPGIAQYAILWLSSNISGMFTITTVWWEAIVIGLAFALFRFSTPSEKK